MVKILFHQRDLHYDDEKVLIVHDQESLVCLFSKESTISFSLSLKFEREQTSLFDLPMHIFSYQRLPNFAKAF
ncbi:hypothetical protein RIR_jg31976.t1 [Rhizophagus irregularis DAOM 181602=DAOM 197198]|nr:hypothetical protein RIR_jg31976.t1 [Rhizophagus irregularis DAOM 181602=DAOM 197198]